MMNRSVIMKKPDMKQARKRTKNEFKYVSYDKEYSAFGKGKKYFLRTYGCQMNVHDSEEIAALLENLGCIPCEELEDADIAILNTCAIRENAHDKVFGFFRKM
jgi:tRNA-2-methylthio-N6-dimethylallyladenosine synthase